MKIFKNLADLLLFNGSRKVGFGLWLFIVANYFRWNDIIDIATWMGSVVLSSGLIGGGTIADTFLDRYKGGKKNDPKSEQPA